MAKSGDEPHSHTASERPAARLVDLATDTVNAGGDSLDDRRAEDSSSAAADPSKQILKGCRIGVERFFTDGEISCSGTPPTQNGA